MFIFKFGRNLNIEPCIHDELISDDIGCGIEWLQSKNKITEQQNLIWTKKHFNTAGSKGNTCFIEA